MTGRFEVRANLRETLDKLEVVRDLATLLLDLLLRVLELVGRGAVFECDLLRSDIVLLWWLV